MRMLYTILFICFISLSVSAQTGNWAWQKMLQSSYNAYNPMPSSTDYQGNVFYGGTFTNNITIDNQTFNTLQTYDQKLFIVKYDSQGNIQWAKSSSNASTLTALTTDTSGNVIITGAFSGNLVIDNVTLLQQNANSTSQNYIMKLNPQGNVIWAQISGANLSAHSIVLDQLGYVYITGSINYQSATIGNISYQRIGQRDFFVAKFNSEGIFSWMRTASGYVMHEGCSIAVDAFGNIYVTGGYVSSLLFGTQQLADTGNYDIYFVKYDSSGNIVWANSYNAYEVAYTSGIALDTFGNIYITGRYSGGGIQFGTTLFNSTPTYTDVFLVKFNPSGNVIWAKKFYGSSYDGPANNLICTNNKIYLAGYSFSPTLSFDQVSVTNNNPNHKTLFISVFSLDGQLLWLDNSATNNYDISITSIAVSPQGYIFVSGCFQGTSVFGTASYTSPQGNYAPYIARYDSGLLSNKSLEKRKAVLYPNPVKDVLNLNLGNGEKVRYKIIDTNGKTLITGDIDDSSAINTSALPQGIYIFSAGDYNIKFVHE